jgi:DNA/RNA endonuclease YhcR with UshA esterase domain
VKIAVFCVKESFLIKICLLGSVAGILSIYFLSFMIVPEEIGAGEITENHAGRKVKLSGTVEGFRLHSNGHVFFEVTDDTGSVDVVIWEEKVEQLMLSGTDVTRITEGISIELTGTVELYRGSVQVVI